MLLGDDGSLHADEWWHLADNEPLSDDAKVTVSHARWTKDEPTLRARVGGIGLRLPNDAAPEDIARDLNRLDIVVLDFPIFTDGRAYSQARLLRDRHRFKGELRASGNVLRDQLLFMKRCGFTSFAVSQRAIDEDWGKAFGEFDVFYQKAQDARPWVMRQRLERIR